MTQQIQLTEILLGCFQVERMAESQKQLDTALAQHPTAYLRALMLELADESKPPNVRQLAGIQLKNALGGKSKSTVKLAHHRWLEVHEDVKRLVREKLVETLQSPLREARNTGAQVLY